MRQSEPVNALLNYGYTILESVVRKNLISASLLPDVGFVHKIGEAKEPLCYDMEEPFREVMTILFCQFFLKYQSKISITRYNISFV